MADDDQDGPWVTDWDEIDGIVDEEEWDDVPDRPRRVAPLAADRYDGGGDGGDGDGGGYDDYDDDDGRRRRGVLVGLLALVLVLGGIVAAALLVSADDDGDVDTIATSTSRPRPSTTTTKVTPTSIGPLPGQTSTTAVGGGSSTTVKSTTSTTKAAVTTSTTEASDDPVCTRGSTANPGANDPMEVAFCVDDPSPKVGQIVTVNGTAVDRNAEVESQCIKVSWEGEPFTGCAVLPTPDPEVINQSYTFKHAFTKPGTYTIHVGAISNPANPPSNTPDPRQSFAEATVKITVHA
jgi:hypothetical protein